MRLYDLAHARAGDKGDISDISVIARRPQDYPLLRDVVTAERVREHFADIVGGPVERYEVPQLYALKFVLHDALGGGVTRTRTLDPHGPSLSSSLRDMALGAHRSEVLVATKLNGRMGPDPNAVGQSRHHIVDAVHGSLRRLGTDWIDILQVHGIDAWTDMEASLRALDDLVRAGTVRYIGCSNYSAWHLMKALSISDRRGWERFCVTQVHYSLIAREVEHELVPLSLDQDVGMVAWSPLSSGLLSGRYRAGAPAPPDGRFALTSDPPVDDLDRAYRIVEVLVAIAEERSASPAQVALAWLLGRPAVTAVTLGARSHEQLRDNLGAADLRLTDEEAARLDAVSDRPLPYPYWHQRKYNAERSQRDQYFN